MRLRPRTLKEISYGVTFLGMGFIILSIALNLLIPHFVNLQALKTQIETSIHDSTGIRVQVQTLEIQPTLFEGVKVVFENNVIYDPKDVRIARAGEINAYVSYLPLLNKKTQITKLAFNNVTMFIGEKSFLFRLKKPKSKVSTVMLKNATVEFNNYHIVVDRYFDGINNYDLHGEFLSLQHIQSDYPLVLNARGDGFFGVHAPASRIGNFVLYARADQALAKSPTVDPKNIQEIRIAFENVNLPTLSAIANAYKVPISARGKVDYLNIDILNQNAHKLVTIRSQLTQKTTIDVVNAYLKKHFEIQPGQLMFQTGVSGNLAQWPVALDGLFFQLQGPHTDLTVKGQVNLQKIVNLSTFKLHVICKSLPIETLTTFPLALNPQSARWQTMDGIFSSNFHIKGSISNPQVQGRLNLKNFRVRDLQGGPDLVKEMSGTILIHSLQDLELGDFHGILTGGAFSLNGKFNTQTREQDLLVLATHVDLDRLRTLIIQFDPKLKALQALLIRGTAELRLRTNGPLSHPNATGRLKINQLALLNTMHRPIVDQTTGQILFQGRTIRIPQLQGWIQHHPIMVSGAIQPDAQQLDLNIQGQQIDLAGLQQSAQMLAAAVNSPLARTLKSGQMLGTSAINLTASGSFQKPTLSGQLSLNQAQFKTKKLNIAGITTTALFSRYQMTFSPVQARLNNLSFKASGQFNNDFQEMHVHLEAPHTQLAAVMQLLKTFSPVTAQKIAMTGVADVDTVLTGPIHHPAPQGNVTLHHVQLTYVPQKITVDNLSGRLTLLPQQTIVQNLQGSFKGAPFSVNGTLSNTFRPQNLAIKARQVQLAMLENTAGNIQPALLKPLKALGIHSGTADFNMVLSPHYAHGVGGSITLNHAVMKPPQLGQSVTLSQLHYNLQSGQVAVPGYGLHLDKFRFSVAGIVAQSGYNVKIASAKLPMSFLREEAPLFEKITHRPLPKLYNTAGMFQVNTKLVSHQLNETRIRFYNAGASLQTLPFPIYDINGSVLLALSKKPHLYTDNLSFRYANSPITLSIDMNTLKDIYLEASGTISPLLLNSYFLTHGAAPSAYAALPFNVSLSGSIGQLSGEGRGNNLNLFLNFNIASLFNDPAMEVPRQPGSPALDQANLSSVIRLVGNTLQIEQTRFRADAQNSVLLAGQVNDVFHPQTRQVDLSVVTEPTFHLAALTQQIKDPLTEGLAGSVDANVHMKSSGGGRIGYQGQVQFNHIQSPALNLQDLNGALVFEGLNVLFNLEHFQFPGVDIGVQAIGDISHYPMTISDLHAVGKEFVVSESIDWVNNIILGKLRQTFWDPFFPRNYSGTGNLPYQITNGTVFTEEGIVNNLIVQNYSSTIKVSPNTYFELDNIRTESAGGKAQGSFSMFPRNNNFMTVSLDIDRMKANAVSRTLLNVSNQVFGRLSGHVDYTTFGFTQNDMLANANGSAQLHIDNGRLPSVARIETLLIAANTISGGLANLNLNSLLHLAEPFRTDYFAKLTGTFKVVDGIVMTDDMESHGKNLDLFIKGKIRLVDSVADLVVKGQLDQDISGALGSLGELSIGRVAGFLGLRSIVNHIPGVGFIPGFGGPRTKGIAFEVDVKGPVLDPGSIGDFHWVK